MGTFTQTIQYVQSILLQNLQNVFQRDGQAITLRDGTTAIVIASDYIPIDVDPDVTEWLYCVYRQGGSVSAARQSLVHDLVVGLKADGIWTKLDRLWLLAAENQQSALTDLVNSGVAVAVNAPTFTVDRGFTFDGATNYIDTGYVPTTGPAYALNSAHAMASVRVMQVGGTNAALTGVIGSNSDQSSILLNDTVSTVSYINDTAVLTQGSAPSASMRTINRPSSSARAFWRDNTKQATDATAPAGVPDVYSFYVGAVNNAGVAANFGAHRIAAVSYGSGLADIDFTASGLAGFFHRITNYQIAIGA